MESVPRRAPHGERAGGWRAVVRVNSGFAPPERVVSALVKSS
jgi:hypothetical protein